jgi:hypothetical protein
MYRKHPRNANRLDYNLGRSGEFLYALLPSQWLRSSRQELIGAFILSRSLGLANLRLDQKPYKDQTAFARMCEE